MSCAHESRCTGHCCRNFYLPDTLEGFKAERDRALCWLFGAPGGNLPHFPPMEVIRVAEMILSTDDPHLFNCRHHDATTGDCLNYENRPELCRDYPYFDRGGRCRKDGCTWEEARNPPINIRRPVSKATA